MPPPRSSTLPRQSANAPAAEPIADTELEALFTGFSSFKRIALAVSGGPDSLALMYLALAWRALQSGQRPDLLVLTLDHGLRPEAADEAARVAATAATLGLAARILTRDPPASPAAVQESARADRYRLLREAAQLSGADAIATGHTLDDQAETLLMRLARGSGIDGLSAMAPVSRLGDFKLLRPLLGVPKARLEATLTVLGVPWTVDPSNANPAFERPRLRAAMPVLLAAGLTPTALAMTARRLARGREALEQVTQDAARRLVIVHDEGYFEIDRPGFDALPEEIRLRLLGRLIARLGTPDKPERLARLERLVSLLANEAHHAASLAGCLIQAAHDRIRVLREPGRLGLPTLELRPGETAEWDRRCRVSLAAIAPAPAIVRALTADDLTGKLAAVARASATPRPVLLSAPSVWRGGALLALPLLGIGSPEVAIASTLALAGEIHDNNVS